MLRRALLLAAAALGSATSAQPSLRVLDPGRAVSQYLASSWGDAEGLPQSRVEAIAQSSDGLLWFGTQEGLARFDGVTFTVIGRGEGQLPDGDVRALAPDADGGVWVGTRRGGLAHVGADLAVRVFGEDAGLPSLAVAAVAVEPDGDVWAGTFDGLCRLPAGGSEVACLDADDGLPTSYVRTLLLGRGGVLWVGTREGLARVDRGRVTSLADLGGAAATQVGALAEDADGGLWIGPYRGVPLGYLRDGRLRTPPGADAAGGANVEALLVDNAGSLWIGTGGGGLLRIRGEAVERVTEADGADLSSVLALLQDHEGSLWIGTGGGGLARLRNAKFLPITARQGLPDDRAYTIAPAPDGGVWVGTTGGLARVRGGRVVATLTDADGLPGTDVSTVLALRDGTVWAGVEGGGLCRIVGGRVGRCLTEGDGLPDPFVIALHQAPDGTFWVGSASGLSRWTGTTLEPLDVPGSPEDAVTALADRVGGGLWIGTYGGGLYEYDGRRVRPVLATASDNVLSVLARPDGTVWMGTDGSGLALLDGGALYRLTTAQGIPAQIIPQILEDGQGRLWLTSNRGVAAAAADSLALAAQTGTAVAMTRYGRADGLPSAEANGGSQPAGAVAADGTLYFPTNGGVAAIDPAAIGVNRQPPPVVVKRLVIDGRPVPARDGLTLAPGASEFEFDYAGLSFFAPDRVRHRYRLEGRDDDWTEAGTRREAFYTDLAPGNYVFRVQAANDDGVWSETDATVAFTLRPHFWQTGWFLVLSALALVGLAFAAYTARTAQLRARAVHLEGVVAARTRELADEKAQVEHLNGQLSTFNARLQKYFPTKVAERILRQEGDVTVGAERRPVTVVFTDLAGFTRLSEATPPAQVTALLNEYLNEMVALIDTHGGTLDKFMGDGIMVLFGAADPMDPEEQARRAVAMAVEMQAAMARLRARWQAEGLEHPIDLRIGIHQAEVTVGNFGSDELVEFTAIGRGVNLAARLEGACAPGGVLVSEAVRALTDDVVGYAAPQAFRLKGIEGEVQAFPVAAEALAGGHAETAGG